VEYNPKADPTQCNKLLECLDPAPRTALLRQLAAAFDLPTVRLLHSRGIKAAIAKGTGANGKDSIRAAISKIFCGQMTGLGLSEFQAYDNGRKFGLSMLEHSLVNWSSENNMGTTLDRVEALNICVTGEEGGIMIERKGKDSYAFTPKAIHIFNTNQIPKLRSGMESLLSRFVVYDFNKTFKQNPNPKRGELQADPRFHDDPQFLIKEVCPALLNRLLGELKNLAIEGIDYDALKAGLDEIQEESTHLWAFVNETKLEIDPEGKVGITELWESLKEWYLDTGTLVLDEPEPGRFKYTWHEQANPHDRNVTGSNQVYKRFKQLFPNIKRDRETSDQQNKGRFFIFGLKLKNSSSLLHSPDSATVSASPDASLFDSPSYSASLSLGEAKNEAVVKQQTLAVQGSEAVKQNSHIVPNSATPEDQSQDDDDLVPEYFQQFGYVFPLRKILVHAVTGRTVMTTEFTLSGSGRTNKEYLCTFLDDETTAYIPQNKLQEL
jgi:putative DNA primase/helicase